MTVINNVKAPWLDNYGDVPANLDYFKGTMFEALCKIAGEYPDNICYDFMGKKTKYPAMIAKIEDCARGLLALGIKKGDKVTVCLPNCPQSVIMFYAINRIGAIASMIHPLSGENEIKFYLEESESVAAITLDQFYPKFAAIRGETQLKTLIIASIKDELPGIVKVGFALTEGRKIASIPADADVVLWNDLMKAGKNTPLPKIDADINAPAVILYSGGTTGVNKGILLSNFNFNALGEQVIATNPIFAPGDKMLAVMPVFHGFGLGVSIHTMLMKGGRCVLVPRFNAESYAKLLKKHKCNFIAGVPTLYEALIRQESMNGVDLSFLKGCFSGGDSLSPELKKKFDKFLADHGASIVIREGYGTTECVTASCLTPMHLAKEGSIGQPFPDTFYKIVTPGTNVELPLGMEGEICISGPTVMLGYYKHEEETANTLRTHEDGRVWVHTGDLGLMDEDGFIYFRQRIKRMIITSGYNVYPSAVENIIDALDFVQMSCVIGLPDDYKGQKIKAFVMLKEGITPTDEHKALIIEHCKKNVARYAMPYEIEFRDSLPKTLVGKVAYRVLEEEELSKIEK